MLTGPICWLHTFLNGKDDPETPYLSEFIKSSLPDSLQSVFKNEVQKTGALQKLSDSSTIEKKKPVTNKLDLEIWQADFYAKLGQNRLGLAVLMLQRTEKGKKLVERMRRLGFPPHFFVQIHKPYLEIWGTSEFGTIYPGISSGLYEQYLSVFLDLYEISFYELELVFLLPASTNIAGIVEFYETTCKTDPAVLRDHLRKCRKEHQSSLYNIGKV